MRELKKFFVFILTMLTITFTQILCWGVVTLADYLAEVSPVSESGGLAAAVFGLPAFITLLYLLLGKKMQRNGKAQLVNTWDTLVVWVIENVIITLPVLFLVGKNEWLVHQNMDVNEHFLNGIEYLIFSIMNIVEPLILIIIWSILVFICWIFKKLFLRAPRQVSDCNG